MRSRSWSFHASIQSATKASASLSDRTVIVVVMAPTIAQKGLVSHDPISQYWMGDEQSSLARAAGGRRAAGRALGGRSGRPTGGLARPGHRLVGRPPGLLPALPDPG